MQYVMTAFDAVTIAVVLSGVRSVKRQLKKHRVRQAQMTQVVSNVRRIS